MAGLAGEILLEFKAFIKNYPIDCRMRECVTELAGEEILLEFKAIIKNYSLIAG